MRVNFLAIFYVIFLGGFFKVRAENVFTEVVETQKGPVRGVFQKTIWNGAKYSAFKGIPYARPPIGYRRFQPPEEAESWTEILDGGKEGENCVQIDFLTQVLSGDEDCLYLNVYTPWTSFRDEKKDLMAVMVWIYGGSFKQGYSNSNLYGPDFIIEENVVLVTFNYRVGPFGFMSLQHQNCTGNAGLKDQSLVLRWVQKNIRNFGGNPERVTIFGQSAGAVATDFHSLSDMSKGLFQRSISMSGSVYAPWAFHKPEVAVERAFKLARKLGFRGKKIHELLKFFYNAPAGEMAKAADDITLVDLPFKPTLENSKIARKSETFMTECSVNRYKRGNFSKLPHLMGYTAEEALGFAYSLDNLKKLVDYLLSIIDELGSFPGLDISGSLNFLRRGIDFTKKISTATIMNIVSIASDLLFIAPIDLKQKTLSRESSEDLYYYRFSYDSEYAFHRVQLNITSLNGTAHGDDIGYFFNTAVLDVPTDKDHPFSIFRRKVVRLWTNFAKYSNPTPIGKDDEILGSTWLRSGRRGKQLDINENLTMKPRLASIRAEFYELGMRTSAPVLAGCKKFNPFDSLGLQEYEKSI